VGLEPVWTLRQQDSECLSTALHIAEVYFVNILRFSDAVIFVML